MGFFQIGVLFDYARITTNKCYAHDKITDFFRFSPDASFYIGIVHQKKYYCLRPQTKFIYPVQLPPKQQPNEQGLYLQAVYCPQQEF